MAARSVVPAGAGVPLAVLALGAFASGTDSFVIAGLLAPVATDLGVGVGSVGVTVTLFAVAYAVGGPLLVAALVRVPPRRLMVGSLAVFVAGNLAAAAAPSLGVLAAARVVAALGAGVFMPGAVAAAAALGGPRHRGRAVAVVAGGASVALVVGVPLGTLTAVVATWRGSFVLVALLGAIAALGVALRVADPPPAPAPTLRARLAVLRRGDVVAVLAVTLLANTAAFAIYPYLGALFPAAGAGGVSLLVLAFGLGAVAGTWLGGQAADRWGPTPVTAVVVAVFALAHLLLGALAGSVLLGVGYALVWGLAGWATIPAQQGRLLARCESATAPLALSLNSSATHLGTGLGALAGAAVLAGPGPGRLWVVAGALSLIALVLVAVGERARRGAVVA